MEKTIYDAYNDPKNKMLPTMHQGRIQLLLLTKYFTLRFQNGLEDSEISIQFPKDQEASDGWTRFVFQGLEQNCTNQQCFIVVLLLLFLWTKVTMTLDNQAD